MPVAWSTSGALASGSVSVGSSPFHRRLRALWKVLIRMRFDVGVAVLSAVHAAPGAKAPDQDRLHEILGVGFGAAKKDGCADEPHAPCADVLGEVALAHSCCPL
jgi:hypothetical protein